MNKRETPPPNLEPVALVWTLISAMTDALNLRHLRSELYGEAADLIASGPLRDLQIADRTAPFDQRLAQVGLNRSNVEVPAQHARAKIDVGP